MRETMRRAVAMAFLGTAAFSVMTAGVAHAQAVTDESNASKQIALTQSQIDHLAEAQKDVRAAEGSAPQDKTDGAADAKVAAAVKSHGFASLEEFSNVSFSVDLVMSGIDPETKAYVGPAAIIGKQIKQVEADKAMPAADKKQALEELNAALQKSQPEKPLTPNVELVRMNYDKLSQAMQQAD